MLRSSSFLVLAALANAQVADLIPSFNKTVAVHCIANSTAQNSDVPRILSSSPVETNWTWVAPWETHNTSIFRFFDKSIRSTESPILSVSTDCNATSSSVNGSYGVGSVDTTQLITAKLNRVISTYNLEIGYQMIAYNDSGSVLNVTGDSTNRCLTSTSWDNSISSFTVTDLNYFYIKSEVYSNYARANGNTGQLDANVVIGAMPKGFVWELWKTTQSQFIAVWFGSGLNCNSFGSVPITNYPSTLRVIVPTTSVSSNAIITYQDNAVDYKVNMAWVHDQGYFLCNATFAAADVSVVGTFTLLNCSSDSVLGVRTTTDTPFFYVRYTPKSGYNNSLSGAKSVAYTFQNGPFAFSGSISVTVKPPNNAPTFDEISKIGLLPGAVATINVTVRDADLGDSVAVAISGTSSGGSASITQSPIATGSGYFVYTVTFTPLSGYIGDVSITLFAKDSAGAVTSYTISITYATTPSITPSPSPSISVSPSASPMAASPAPATSGENSSPSDTGSNAALIGGVVGGIGGALLIGGAVAAFFIIKKRQNASPKPPKHTKEIVDPYSSL